MSYNPTAQYRCTIIRGKAKTALDNLLPAYANIVFELCPIPKEKFNREFNERLGKILVGSQPKTLDNHRTEIVGKLFGMYYEDDEGIVFCSGRTEKYIEDNDQPAFFKDICYKFQFPNGMDWPRTIRERIENSISLRQFPFVVQLLVLAKNYRMSVSVDDIGYYILNSLDVLQGKSTPEEVVKLICEDKKTGIQRTIPRKGSYHFQHIREQINLLELANMIIVDGQEVLLNSREYETVKIFNATPVSVLPFGVYGIDLSTSEQIGNFRNEWQKYYSEVSDQAGSFETAIAALDLTLPEEEPDARRTTEIDKIQLGDDGEMFVYQYEKKRVDKYNHNLARKVVHLGKTKGLGYDIQSVVAEPGETDEFVKYIEVKSTKRVTMPDMDAQGWFDSFNLTRTEWIAAVQHKEMFEIYRVYFTHSGTKIFVIKNVYQKNKDSKLKATPLMYRIDFGTDAVDKRIDESMVKEAV